MRRLIILKRLALTNKGATAIEYGIILALVALTILSAATLLGGEVLEDFLEISSAVATTKNGM